MLCPSGSAQSSCLDQIKEARFTFTKRIISQKLAAQQPDIRQSEGRETNGMFRTPVPFVGRFLLAIISDARRAQPYILKYLLNCKQS